MITFKDLRERHNKFMRARKTISRRAAWDMYENMEEEFVRQTYDEDLDNLQQTYDAIWKKIRRQYKP